MSLRLLLAGAVLSTACSAAHADQRRPAMPAARIALDIAPARIRAPYDVQIMRSNGESLPTYSLDGRFYVQGSASERYTIRIANPTARRVEAVVSVDGLDVIDGENGDLGKRGYIVPAYGETRIEGFRTSSADVATFRFSSVSGSYAGQKGKARNVGVIAVALFEEVAAPGPQIIVGEAAAPPPPYDHRDRDGTPGGYGASKSAPAPVDLDGPRSAGPARRAAPSPTTEAEASAAEPAASADDSDERFAPPASVPARRRERLGLGTAFGEQRYSAASFTRFVRAPGRPVAIAELRYNDAAGLLALGIPLQPLPDAGEIMTRETADPFPGDRFAQPPR